MRSSLQTIQLAMMRMKRFFARTVEVCASHVVAAVALSIIAACSANLSIVVSLAREYPISFSVLIAAVALSLGILLGRRLWRNPDRNDKPLPRIGSPRRDLRYGRRARDHGEPTRGRRASDQGELRWGRRASDGPPELPSLLV